MSETARNSADTTGPSGPVLFVLAAAMLVFAPLVRGGNRPIPLLVLELVALAALVILAWDRARAVRVAHLPAALAFAAALVAGTTLVQLVPVPYWTPT